MNRIIKNLDPKRDVPHKSSINFYT